MVRLQKCTNSVDAVETPHNDASHQGMAVCQGIVYTTGNEEGLNIVIIKSYIREVHDSGTLQGGL